MAPINHVSLGQFVIRDRSSAMAPIVHVSLGQIVIRDRESAMAPIVHASLEQLLSRDRVSAALIDHVSLGQISSTIARRARVSCCVVAGVKSRSPVYFFFFAIRRSENEWVWFKHMQTFTKY